MDIPASLKIMQIDVDVRSVAADPLGPWAPRARWPSFMARSQGVGDDVTKLLALRAEAYFTNKGGEEGGRYPTRSTAEGSADSSTFAKSTSYLLQKRLEYTYGPPGIVF